MKKSSSVKLLFVTGILAACAQETSNDQWGKEKKVYMRSDTTASYTRSHGFLSGFLLYHAFRPYGAYSKMVLIKEQGTTVMPSAQNLI